MEPFSQRFQAHSILNCQRRGFVQLTNGAVARLGGINWNSTSLFGECEGWISRRIRGYHGRIVGQLWRRAELLLFEIYIRNGHPRRWLNQAADPRAGAEHVSGTARLIATGPGLES